MSALAQDVKFTSLPKDHPLVGTWKIDLPETKCFETYHFRANGTRSFTSGTEIGEAEFKMSVNPSHRGFYKWVDKITKDNGKPDCMGLVTEVGHLATNYISLDRSGKKFFLCDKEALNTCVGPFVRQDGI
jgi:hypothetical protein